MTTIEGQVPALGCEDAYREYRLTLLRLAYLISGSHEVSEDAVQSVFASAQVGADALDQGRPPCPR